jgi:hypothetical protein
VLTNRNPGEKKAFFHAGLALGGLIFILCADNALTEGETGWHGFVPAFGVFREEGERLVTPNFPGQDGCGRPFFMPCQMPSPPLQ